MNYARRMDDIEQRLAKIEGRIFAHNAILASLVSRAAGNDLAQMRLLHGNVTAAIEGFYKMGTVTGLGHLALQSALDTADAILEPDKSSGGGPKADRP